MEFGTCDVDACFSMKLTLWMCLLERVQSLGEFHRFSLVCKASAHASRKMRDLISYKFAIRCETKHGGWQTYLAHTKNELLHGSLGICNGHSAGHKILKFRYGQLEEKQSIGLCE